MAGMGDIVAITLGRKNSGKKKLGVRRKRYGGKQLHFERYGGKSKDTKDIMAAGRFTAACRPFVRRLSTMNNEHHIHIITSTATSANCTTATTIRQGQAIKSFTARAMERILNSNTRLQRSLRGASSLQLQTAFGSKSKEQSVPSASPLLLAAVLLDEDQ